MRKIKLFTILLLSLMITLGMSQAVFAEGTSVTGGTYVYDGNKITDNAGGMDDEDLDKLPKMEPGDDLTIVFTYTNNSNDTTYWYLENEIINTLFNEIEGKDDHYLMIKGLLISYYRQIQPRDWSDE